ncbi:DUF4173 domain-containing protein [Pseudonocardia sp. CA-107938]|uniref:DUF4153 domain-containing protein n=1 Tax=Pseudonocardia sp. CA-107938 TaxID=3240021 RepID=UPI003D91FD54
MTGDEKTGGAPADATGAAGAPTTNTEEGRAAKRLAGAEPVTSGHAAAVRAAAGRTVMVERPGEAPMAPMGPVPPMGPMRPMAPPLPPQPVPPLFGDRWPVPAAPPSVAMVAGTAIMALTTAGAVPEGRPGLGWLVTALVGVAATLAVEWRHRRITPEGVWWTAATVALAAVCAVRAAEWLGVLCLLAAFGTGTLAIVGRSGRGVLAAAATLALAACRAVPWFGKSATERTDLRRAVRVGVAVAAGALLLLVFGGLLASADPVFGKLVEGLTPRIDDGAVRWFVLAAFGAAGMAGTCFLSASAPRPPAPMARRRLSGLEWTIPVGFLVVLFAGFLAVTVTTMFAGDAYVQATAGITYAEYARGGFWQLLWVTVLALLVIIAAARFAPVETALQRRAKRGLLTALTILTLLVVASATHRMVLYQQAYGHTVQRLVVLTVELWLGVAFVLVTWSVLRLRDRIPTRAMVGTGVAALLALAVLDPERFVAQENVERFAVSGKLDAHYLSTLSADALGPLEQLADPVRSCIRAEILRDVPGDDWRSANLARARAGAQPVPACTDPKVVVPSYRD